MRHYKRAAHSPVHERSFQKSQLTYCKDLPTAGGKLPPLPGCAGLVVFGGYLWLGGHLQAHGQAEVVVGRLLVLVDLLLRAGGNEKCQGGIYKKSTDKIVLAKKEEKKLDGTF